MKRFSYFSTILTVICIALFSCAKDTLNKDIPFSYQETPISTIITIDDAIGNLMDILSQIDPPTRGGIRKVKNYHTIHANDYTSHNTRSTCDTTSLIYLVNFEEDSGYAALSANTQIKPSVIFIADNGCAHISDFINDNNCDETLTIEDIYYEPDDDYFLGAVTANNNGLTLQQDIINNIVSLRDDRQTSDPFDDETFLPHTIPYINKSPLIKTLWHQNYPYNKNFPKKQDSNTDNCPAGCTVIATGQLLTFLSDIDIETNFNISNTTWKEIEQFQVDPYDSPDNSDNYNSNYKTKRENIAIILKHIADKINVKYNYGIGNSKGTYGRPVMIANYLKSLGYNVTHLKNRPNISKDTQSLINTSLDNNHPVLVGALGSYSGSLSGHCWIIDGCKYINTADDWINHINLGWGDHSGNGWYFRNCFDSTQEYTNMYSNSEDISITRLAPTGEFKYNWAFNILIVD